MFNDDYSVIGIMIGYLKDLLKVMTDFIADLRNALNLTTTKAG
jgi:hypothetical protein